MTGPFDMSEEDMVDSLGDFDYDWDEDDYFATNDNGLEAAYGYDYDEYDYDPYDDMPAFDCD
jgi:hypothetical protein